MVEMLQSIVGLSRGFRCCRNRRWSSTVEHWKPHRRELYLSGKRCTHTFLSLCPSTAWFSERQGPQFSAEHGILSRGAEFARFRSISVFLRNSIRAIDQGKKWHILVSSGGHTVCIHDFATRYMTATRALMGEILKILRWPNLADIFPVYLVTNSICHLH